MPTTNETIKKNDGIKGNASQEKLTRKCPEGYRFNTETNSCEKIPTPQETASKAAAAQGQKFYAGGKEVTKQQYDQYRAAQGFERQIANAGAPSPEVQNLIEQQRQQALLNKVGGVLNQPATTDPSQNISIETQENPKQSLGDIRQSQLREAILGEKATNALFPDPLGINPDPTVKQQAIGGAAALGVVGGVTAAPVLFTVGGQTLGGRAAVQAGVSARNAATTREVGKKIFNFAVGGYAALKTTENIVNYFTGASKLNEQQQALNTVGQMTSTIVGDSTSARGDWKKGREELIYLKNQILLLEKSMQEGSIRSATVKHNGKVYDLNADIEDQLRTIDEGIRDIESFALQGQFPELSDAEIQNTLRELETEGYIKPVDLTQSRRGVENVGLQ